MTPVTRHSGRLLFVLLTLLLLLLLLLLLPGPLGWLLTLLLMLHCDDLSPSAAAPATVPAPPPRDLRPKVLAAALAEALAAGAEGRPQSSSNSSVALGRAYEGVLSSMARRACLTLSRLSGEWGRCWDGGCEGR